MKRRLLIPLAAVVCLLLASCHKTCTCYGYDFLEYNYTADEVDSLMNGSCDNMIYQANTRYYSYCFWQ